MAAIFPSAVATTLQMLQAANNTKVTLNVNAGIGDTTLTVDDPSPLPTSGFVTFDDNEANPETIQYTGKSGVNLTGVTRGADSTAAGTHTAGAHLEMRWNAAYHNTLATEIIAVEQNISDRFGVGTNIVVPGTVSFTFAKTTNQIILGTTNTVTISSTAPASSRTYTIPDAGTNAIFQMTEGASTINGATTYTSALTITPTTNQLVLGTTRTVTISAVQPASTSRTWTIPDITGNGTFAALEGTQTFTGTKTFNAFTGTISANIAAGGFKFTGLGAGSTAGDSARFEQLHVMQIPISAVLTTEFSTTSSTYQATGLSVSITPTSASSKILIIVNCAAASGNSSSTAFIPTIKRNNTTDLSPGGVNGFLNWILNTGTGIVFSFGMIHLDSPATTSATTYQVYLKSSNNSSTVRITPDSNDQSEIIVMEVI